MENKCYKYEKKGKTHKFYSSSYPEKRSISRCFYSLLMTGVPTIYLFCVPFIVMKHSYSMMMAYMYPFLFIGFLCTLFIMYPIIRKTVLAVILQVHKNNFVSLGGEEVKGDEVKK